MTRSEWLAVLGIVSLIVTLGAVHFFSSPRLPPSSQDSATLTVSIEGAVGFPGLYPLAAGSSLSDLLSIVEPLPKANLSECDLKRSLKDGEQIVISLKRTFRVFVEGAVPHPRPYEVEEGTTVGQLLRSIELSEEAVTYSLPKRQLLKDGEVIRVPSRKRGKSPQRSIS